MPRYAPVSLVVLAVVLGLGTAAFAANQVAVESKTVGINSSISIGVYFENDVQLAYLGIPLEFRTVSGSAYPLSIAAHYNSAGRLPLGGPPPVAYVYSYDLEDGTCRGGTGGFATVASQDGNGVTLDPASNPDAFYFLRLNSFPAQPLNAGSDFPIGTNPPSMLFDVQLSADPGSFIIDSTCTDPSNHLYFVPNPSGLIVPTFTPGVITVTPCDCPYQADLDESGAYDAIDLNLMIDILFFNATNIQDPACPTWRCDLNNDGVTDAVDFNVIIYMLFFAGGTPPCDPCNPVQEACF